MVSILIITVDRENKNLEIEGGKVSHPYHFEVS